MKKLFIAVISMAALASCTQEDIVINNANNAIAFDNAFVSTTTKAIDPSITTDNIVNEKFYVWGTTQGDHAANAPIVPIFTEEEVAFEDGDWAYDVNKTQYWIDGNTYNFAAVKNGTVTKLEKGLPATIHYSLGNTGPDLDLLYASYGPYEAEATGNSKVVFKFSHLLSKAVFTFKNTTPAAQVGATDQPDNIYKVTKIEISGLDADANYDVASGKWIDNTNSNHTEEFGDIVAADATAVTDAAEIREQESGKSNYERLLIPGTHNVIITCTITLYNGTVADNRIVDVIDYKYPLSLTLEAGHSYNFLLSAGLNDSIKFHVDEVKGWTDVDAPAVDTPNHDNTPSA